MRDKQEILNEANKDITNDRYKQDAPLWLTYRLIEVLLDIRDAVSNNTRLLAILEKKTYGTG